MKIFNPTINYILILIIPLLLACEGNEKQESHSQQHNHQHETVFTCPMHPEVKQNEEGRCPKCGMDLVPAKEVDGKQNHQHETVFTCPMHPEVKQNEEGRCPKCGMNLVPAKEVDGKQNHQHGTVFTCPMHPEVKQNEEGRCPKCGMDLVPENADTSMHNEESNKHKQQVMYTCSMHPQIMRKETGRCPICGMDLIPVTTNKSASTQALKMSDASMKLANVKTTTVKKGVLKQHIRMNGKVHINEQNKYIQTSHIPGRIEELVVNYTGMYVKKGTVIAYIYSPALSTAQQELLEAQKIKESYSDLYQASINKLKNWKVSSSQIESILKTKKIIENFPILADNSGYVTKKFVNYGEHIKQGKALYEIADYSSVWAIFDVYETDYHSVRRGDIIHFTVNALPSKLYSGRVIYIDPFIDPKKRTSQVRVVVKNNNKMLLPEMLIVGNLVADDNQGVKDLLVPKSAVLWTGKTAIVFVKSDNTDYNLFSKREVLLGASNEYEYAIKDGLDAGEVIVSNGVFSVDASAQLAGKPSMMN